MSSNGNSEVGAFLAVVSLILAVMFTPVAIYRSIAQSCWEKEAISHGAATYMEENGKTVFKWKDEVKGD